MQSVDVENVDVDSADDGDHCLVKRQGVAGKRAYSCL